MLIKYIIVCGCNVTNLEKVKILQSTASVGKIETVLISKYSGQRVDLKEKLCLLVLFPNDSEWL